MILVEKAQYIQLLLFFCCKKKQKLQCSGLSHFLCYTYTHLQLLYNKDNYRESQMRQNKVQGHRELSYSFFGEFYENVLDKTTRSTKKTLIPIIPDQKTWNYRKKINL